MNIQNMELIHQIRQLVRQERYLSAASVGEMLDCSARVVREKYALVCNFPKPHYLPPEGEKGRPAKRWKESEIIKWMDSR